MALEWKAVTSIGEFHSEKNGYAEIPQHLLEEFTLFAPGGIELIPLTMNFITNQLSIGGSVVDIPEALDALGKEVDKVSLYYYQRASSYFGSNSPSPLYVGIDYAVCGWKGNSKKVFLRFDGSSNKIEVRIENV